MRHSLPLFVMILASAVGLRSQGLHSGIVPMAAYASAAAGATTSIPVDSVKTYVLSPVEIVSSKIMIGGSQFPVQKDNLENLIGQNGFTMIRKGDFFAQDVYADGMKRGEITVVIDGERHQCACPNRMDSPLSRVNPLELESIDLSKTSMSIQSGLGGVVNFHRAAPHSAFAVKGGATGSMGAMQSSDAAFSLEGLNHRVSFRYAHGSPYEDASNRDFKQLYGYLRNYDYSLAEGSLQGAAEEWKYGITLSNTDNVSFPYLKMDERTNRFVSSFIGYKSQKLYMNYTDHVMNNDLRVRPALSSMETDAKNFMIGMIGNFYEMYYRNWNADNTIVMQNAAGRIINKLMPNVSLYSASLADTVNALGLLFSGKAGVVYYNMGERTRLGFYQMLYPDAAPTRVLPIFGVAALYTQQLMEQLDGGIMAEAASESPETEYLYTAVNRPKGNPVWSGNPTLKQPIRTTLRGSLSYDQAQVEVFATNIWDYTNLAKRTIGQTNYITYGNIDALMLGTNLTVRGEFLEINASYLWAKNKTMGTPLAEIPPLKIATKLTSPELRHLTAYVKHTYNDAQTRVDIAVSERATPAYNKFDLGVNYALGIVLMSLEAENITNQLYYQHLSYLRDPFASGAIVYEPGRTIRFSIRLNEAL